MESGAFNCLSQLQLLTMNCCLNLLSPPNLDLSNLFSKPSSLDCCMQSRHVDPELDDLDDVVRPRWLVACSFADDYPYGIFWLEKSLNCEYSYEPWCQVRRTLVIVPPSCRRIRCVLCEVLTPSRGTMETRKTAIWTPSDMTTAPSAAAVMEAL